MTKDEIKNIKKVRYKLREKITKCIYLLWFYYILTHHKNQYA